MQIEKSNKIKFGKQGKLRKSKSKKLSDILNQDYHTFTCNSINLNLKNLIINTIYYHYFS